MQNVKTQPRSSYAESFRSIKTNIKYSAFGKDKKVILITSSDPEEGKSTIASNLALTLAMDRKKVVLIDCDLRRPKIHKNFNISAFMGITELLIKETDLKEAIKKYDDYLDIIPAGNIPPSPAELLASEEMDEVLESLKEKYDYIIIDTPPLGVVADAQILASKSDGTILVARQGKTKNDRLLQSKEAIEQVQAKVIGVILNRIKESARYGYKRGGYYYY